MQAVDHQFLVVVVVAVVVAVVAGGGGDANVSVFPERTAAGRFSRPTMTKYELLHFCCYIRKQQSVSLRI